MGFRWIGDVETYITPDMYVGTKLRPMQKKASPQDRAQAYTACAHHEIRASFGKSRDPLLKNDADELKAIAKHCARDVYGPYFYGKTYTTREEFLLLISAIFGNGYQIPGEFTSPTEYTHSGQVAFSPYTNISPRAWFAPLLHEGKHFGMIESGNTWKIAQEISTQDIYTLLSNIAAKNPSSHSGNTFTWTHHNASYTLEL